eukprot:516932_1
MANLMAFDMIRDTYMDMNQDCKITDLTLYCSEEIHYCIEQSTKFIGIPLINLRNIESDERKQINIEQLQKVIELDIKKGYKPMAIIANAGTTNTGTIDDLCKLSDVCKQYKLWFHIDAAYGGLFNITERGKTALNGIQLGDSIVMDPHKTFFMPYGVGALLVKDTKHLKNANSFTGSCMHPPKQTHVHDLTDICDLSFELTRSSRGLGPWFAFKTIGFESFIKELDNKMDLKEQIKKFSDGEIDELNKQFLDKINGKGNIILSAAKSSHICKGKFVVRMSIGSFRTQKS